MFSVLWECCRLLPYAQLWAEPLTSILLMLHCLPTGILFSPEGRRLNQGSLGCSKRLRILWCMNDVVANYGVWGWGSGVSGILRSKQNVANLQSPDPCLLLSSPAGDMQKPVLSSSRCCTPGCRTSVCGHPVASQTGPQRIPSERWRSGSSHWSFQGLWQMVGLRVVWPRMVLEILKGINITLNTKT